MSKLLISVRSTLEAELVGDAGLGILDVKEPDRGSLGACDPEILEEVALVDGRTNHGRVLSFSAGELVDWFRRLEGSHAGGRLDARADPSLVQRYGRELLSRYRYVKIGLAGVANCILAGDGRADGSAKPTFDWRSRWMRLMSDLPSSARSVAVIYVDFQNCGAPSPSEVIELGAKAENCDVVLFDTHSKSGNLFSHISISELNEMVGSARKQKLITVVAGSVDLECLAEVVSVSPDFVGVRGAVCHGNRSGEIARELVDEFAHALNEVLAK